MSFWREAITAGMTALGAQVGEGVGQWLREVVGRKAQEPDRWLCSWCGGDVLLPEPLAYGDLVMCSSKCAHECANAGALEAESDDPEG